MHDKDTEQRVAALQEYQIMDTAPEKSYDNLTQLANFICGTPVSLVTLLDRKRQWFKSCQGIAGISEMPIEHAFCAHAIKQEGLMVVPDLTMDSRFSANPLVTSGPQIRFYAGAPLLTGHGVPLGTICVVDKVPRNLSPEQQQALAALSEQATQLLELRRTILQLTNTIAEKNAAVAEADELKALLPICSYCKNVRDDKDYWHQVDHYFTSRGQARFSHGICPVCMAKFESELAGTGKPLSAN